MPLLHPNDAHLHHLDHEPTQIAIDAAGSLVQAELAPEAATTLHPTIPAVRAGGYSPLIEAEHARLSSGGPKEPGVDLTRYEALDAPQQGDLPGWHATLKQAYAAHEYLRGRETNLALLETYGKNAWLIGNSQLEDLLRAVEKDLEEMKNDLEAVAQSRRAGQENAKGEMDMLERGWRDGLGRMLEAQAAGERLKQRTLEARRAGTR